MLRLLTFGGLRVESDDGPPALRLSAPRLAVLAVISAAGDRGVSRERLVGLFWPESDEQRARHSLRQTLYAVQQDLGGDVIQSMSGTIGLDTAAMTADVADFLSALTAGNRAEAVELMRGPFLDGFYLPGAPAFERWVEEERGRLSTAKVSALLALASEATRLQQLDPAVEWWRQLTAADPLSGRYALGFLKALAARGHRAEALAFARQHEAIVRRELEADPDPEVRLLESALRTMPSPGPRSIDALSPRSPDVGHAQPMVPVAPIEWGQVDRTASSTRSGRRTMIVAVLAALLLIASATWARERGWIGTPASPTLAVGFIREEGVPDSLRVGRVLTDMLATNLARVNGLAVLANSRLLQLMRPGQDSSVGYADAALRAGATELLEGRLLITPHAVLALEMRRVELRTGVVRQVYRVSALDRTDLVDSLTQAIAHQFRLESPGTSVAQAMTSSPVAYRFYEEGLRAYLQADLKGAALLMRAALVEDSTFAMAAYYEVLLAGGGPLPDGRDIAGARRHALRLAAMAPERERLTITATLLHQEMDPRASAVAESLVTKYPLDPRALATIAAVRSGGGDWAGAAEALERAIAFDSLAEPTGEANCRFCQDLGQLADVYFWWDSLAAAERTARRLLRARPDEAASHWLMALVKARLGDSASALEWYRRFRSSGAGDPSWKFQVDLQLEDYETLENDVRPLLASSFKAEWENAAWSYLIALRNQGRLREAWQFHRTGFTPGFPPPIVVRTPDDFNEGILAFERGNGRASAATFARRVRMDAPQWAPGFRARHRAWNGALEGIGLAMAGDTAALRVLADSVERWGTGSNYGRDRKAHHYLRGLLLTSAGRHEEAVREFQAAIHSPSLGFTRVNYELARCLLKLDRPHEAVAALRSALHGATDASNLYITRTELHELLAESFARAGVTDSAAAHYRAVARAWHNADPEFYERRQRASTWLAVHTR